MLTRKFDRAKKSRTEAELAYLGLENSLDPLTVIRWKEEEHLAMEERGDWLTIFELQMKKGNFSGILFPSMRSNVVQNQHKHKFVWILQKSGKAMKLMAAWHGCHLGSI